MKQQEINLRITEILKIFASELNPNLLSVVTDNELFATFEVLNNKCIQLNIKHDGYCLIMAVARKLLFDKLYPNMIENSTKTSLKWIQHQMKYA
jgi:hypothetical protein